MCVCFCFCLAFCFFFCRFFFFVVVFVVVVVFCSRFFFFFFCVICFTKQKHETKTGRNYTLACNSFNKHSVLNIQIFCLSLFP